MRILKLRLDVCILRCFHAASRFATCRQSYCHNAVEVQLIDGFLR